MAHTLLLADDSVTIQRVIELTFADEDVRVVAVSDGDEAIKVLDKTPPDIVLADVGMPGRNGYEVAEHIRKTPRLAHIPVVLLTGAFEKIDEKKAASCDGVLNKPFEPQLVIGRVKELLAKPRQPAPTLDAPLSPPVAPARSIATAAADPPTARPSIDNRDYFDKLDQAFAKLSTESGGAPRSIADAIDWFAKNPQPGESAPAPAPAAPPTSYAPPAAPVPAAPPTSYALPAAPVPAAPPISYAPPAAPVSAAPPVSYTPPAPPPAPKPAEAAPARPAPAPMAASPKPAPPPTLPPLADAFAALLAAEQSSPAPSSAPVWPATAPVAMTDDLVDQVVRRVLEQLSDRVMREAIGEKIAAVAERLVRDEIDRIKSSIK